MGGTGQQINRANWTKQRIAAFRAYLGGNHKVTFRGRKKSGEPYKKSLSVAKLIEYYKPLAFSVRKDGVYVSGGGHGPRKILTDDQVRAKAAALYKHKETGLGKAPSIYNYMKTKWINVSYKKVEQAIQKLPAYQKYQARHVAKPKVRKVIISRGPGTTIDTDVMKFSREYFEPSMNEGFDALAVVVDRFSGFIAVTPLKAKEGGKTADVVAHKTARSRARATMRARTPRGVVPRAPGAVG